MRSKSFNTAGSNGFWIVRVRWEGQDTDFCPHPPHPLADAKA